MFVIAKSLFLNKYQIQLYIFDLRRVFFSLFTADIDDSVRHPLPTMAKMSPEIQSCELLAFSCREVAALCSTTAAAWHISACHDDMRPSPSNSILLTTWQISQFPLCDVR